MDRDWRDLPSADSVPRRRLVDRIELVVEHGKSFSRRFLFLFDILLTYFRQKIIAVITPYMVGEQHGNLKSSVFFVWGGLCTCAFVYTYFLVPETKGLTLEQVDKMFEETTPRTSAKWKPSKTFAHSVARDGVLEKDFIDKVERRGSAY